MKHFTMTQHQEIILMVNGPALTLNFREGKRFSLRPVYVAYEDRETIASGIAETYQRVAAAADIKMSASV